MLRVFARFCHASPAGCIAAVVLVRSWSDDISRLLSFHSSIASDPAFADRKVSRTLTFHIVVTTDAAYPVNALRNIALDKVSTSHVCSTTASSPSLLMHHH